MHKLLKTVFRIVSIPQMRFVYTCFMDVLLNVTVVLVVVMYVNM